MGSAYLVRWQSSRSPRLPRSDPACDTIIQYDVRRRTLVVLLVLSAHDCQLKPLAWGLRDSRHSIRNELSPFAGLAPVRAPFLLLHLTFLFCSVHR